MERVKSLAKWCLRQRWWWPVCTLSAAAFFLQPSQKGKSTPVESPHYLRAMKPLTAGGRADFDDFELYSGAPPGAPGLFVDDQSLERLAQSRYRKDIASGAILRWDDLESASIPGGHRAYVISPENPWLAKGGDRIDVLLRPRNEQDEPVVVAEDVAVLRRLGKGAKGELVVALRQRDLELVEKAKQQGKLTIAVLSKAEPPAPRSKARLPSPRRARRNSQRENAIEIITGLE